MTLRTFGIPEEFLAHAKRGEVLADIGLTPVEIAGEIGAALAGRPEDPERLAGEGTAEPEAVPRHVPTAGNGTEPERGRVARGEKKETSEE